jgi:prepilin-type N-terminal cleavage/methylation domain-containing protein
MKYIAKINRAFTLVELMVVVAIIALLASMAVPSFLRARKRSEAVRVLEDLRLLDAATDQYAIENNRQSGTAVNWADLKNYLKAGSTLYTGGCDVFGYSYGPFTVDSIPQVCLSTFNSLSDVAPSTFWAPY